MKSPRLIAWLLLTNLLVFAGILVCLVRAPGPGAGAGVDQRPLASNSAAALRARGMPSLRGQTASVPFRWAQLESEDYKTYVARLRSIGCPEQTIRDIIIADLDKLLAPQVMAAAGRRPDLKYWQPEEEEMINDVDPAEFARRQREIDRRKREILRELVDADLARERMKASGQEDYYERRLKFLSEDRRTQVRELLEKFDEAEQQLRDKESSQEGGLTAAERAQLRIIRQQRATEIENVLGPDEKRQYELWLSPVANEVRHATYGMNATEEEFTAVYQARKAFEDKWALRDPDLLDAGSRQEMEQARVEMDSRIRQSLGEDRYSDYKRGQDDDWHLLSALVTKFKLPKEKASEVYGYKTVAMDYRQQVQGDPNLGPDQKTEAIRAINEETRKTVRGVIGVKAYSYYLRSGQGTWLEE